MINEEKIKKFVNNIDFDELLELLSEHLKMLKQFKEVEYYFRKMYDKDIFDRSLFKQTSIQINRIITILMKKMEKYIEQYIKEEHEDVDIFENHYYQVLEKYVGEVKNLKEIWNPYSNYEFVWRNGNITDGETIEWGKSYCYGDDKE